MCNLPNCGHVGFTKVSDVLGNNLVSDLGDTVDQLRDLNTQFGLRTYRVWIVRLKWSAGKRGQGNEFVVSEFELLPTPKVMDLTGLAIKLGAIGQDEFGSLMVGEISQRFTEDQLRGWGIGGTEPAADESVFWEIEQPIRPGAPGERRRFNLQGAPSFNPGRFQWTVILERARPERQRNGRP